MSSVKCRPCDGRGLKADNTECEACDGYGILIVDDFRLVPGGGKVAQTATTGATPVKAVEFWPARQVQSVREETLKVWRQDLETRERELLAEVDKVRGGMAQIDEEFSRRASLKAMKAGGQNA